MGWAPTGRTGDAGTAAILNAIEIGYRHLDTAQSYDTESRVGEAARRSGLPRSELFVTTKVADTRLDKSQFMDSVERSLETIGLGPVDLLLIHWPSQNDTVPFEDYVLALAEAQRRGACPADRRLELSDRPSGADRAPARDGAIATNQVEIHPYLQSPKLAATLAPWA